MSSSTDFTIHLVPDWKIQYQDSNGMLHFFFQPDYTTKPGTISFRPIPDEFDKKAMTEAEKARVALVVDRIVEWIRSRPYLVKIDMHP